MNKKFIFFCKKITVMDDIPKFKILERISEGGYGFVNKVTPKESIGKFEKGKVYAVKNFEMYDENDGGIQDSTVCEITIMNTFKHPNILSALYTRYRGKAYPCHNVEMYMEYAISDLSHFTKEYDFLVDKDNAFLQLLCGLRYIHKNRIVHNDIKAQNILVFNNPIMLESGSGLEPKWKYLLKIADFGLAKIIGSKGYIDTPSQTITHRPPEFFDRNSVMVDELKINFAVELKINFAYESDIWAMGIVFVELLLIHMYDYHNFYDLLHSEIEYNKILNRDLNKHLDKFPKTESDSYKKIVLGMLNFDPKKRFTAKECITILKNGNLDSKKQKCSFGKVEYPYQEINLCPKSAVGKCELFKIRNENVQWLIKKFEKQKMDYESIFLSIDILDRYFSKKNVDDQFTKRSKYNDEVKREISCACISLAEELYGYYNYDKWWEESDEVCEPPLISDHRCSILERLNWKIYRPPMNVVFPEVLPEKLLNCFKKNPSVYQIKNIKF